MQEEDLKSIIRKCIKFGDFILTSGKRSSYYVDLKEIITKPKILKEISKRIVEICNPFDKIAGIELGSIPIAVALSMYTDKEFIIIRKERKEHGTRKLYEGRINKGDVFLIVDDVATTGGTLLRAANIVRNEGGIVNEAFVVVDREEGAEELLKKNGIVLKKLFSIRELL